MGVYGVEDGPIPTYDSTGARRVGGLRAPVVGESGTDVPVEPTDGDEPDGGDRRSVDDEGSDDPEALEATFVGPISPGENATLSVTRNGDPVGSATVSVDGEVVGTTDADGKSTIAIPDAEALTVVVGVDDDEVELEGELDGHPPSPPET